MMLMDFECVSRGRAVVVYEYLYICISIPSPQCTEVYLPSIHHFVLIPLSSSIDLHIIRLVSDL